MKGKAQNSLTHANAILSKQSNIISWHNYSLWFQKQYLEYLEQKLLHWKNAESILTSLKNAAFET